MTLGVGQFCTKPGLALRAPGRRRRRARRRAGRRDRVSSTPMTMLSSGIADHFRAAPRSIAGVDSNVRLVGAQTPRTVTPRRHAQLFEVDAARSSRTRPRTPARRVLRTTRARRALRATRRAARRAQPRPSRRSPSASLRRGRRSRRGVARRRWAPSEADASSSNGYPDRRRCQLVDAARRTVALDDASRHLRRCSEHRTLATSRHLPERARRSAARALRDDNPLGIPQRVDGVRVP